MISTQSRIAELLRRQTHVSALGTLFVFTILFLALSQWSIRAEASGASDDTERGKQLFEKRCGGCHSLDKDGEGPRLRNVYGRKAGGVSSFKYSSALKSANVTWDDSSLERWLKNPDSLIPDTDMDFQLPKADERADIIRYLKTISNR